MAPTPSIPTTSIPITPPVPLLFLLLTLTHLHTSLTRPTKPHSLPLLIPLTLLLTFLSLPATPLPATPLPATTLPHQTIRLLRQGEQPANVPIPSVGGPSPSPSPPPPPTQPPAQTNPPQQQPVAPAPVPGGTVSQQQINQDPTLDQCGGALIRMQIVLLIEFFAEVIFTILRILATDDEDEPTLDMSFRSFIFIRGIYAVPVIALNVSILWIGGGPTGACLPAHSQLQVSFTHLILYALYCLAFVVLGMYRLGEYDSEDTSSYYSSYYSSYPYYMRSWARSKFRR